MNEAEQRKATVRARIVALRGESRDPYFTQYMTQLMNDLDMERVAVEQVDADVERSYKLYCERMGVTAAAGGEPVKPILTESVNQSVSTTFNEPFKKPPAPVKPPAAVKPPAPEKPPAPPKQKTPSGAEYTVGAVILGTVGPLFLLTAFITFGITYLEGIVQGVFLYLAPLIVIAIAELLVKRYLPKFSHVLLGLGIATLYATTIINHMSLHIFNSLVAIILTLLTAVVAFFVSRKKDSTSIRIISFLGCYISFLMVASQQNAMEFIISLAILFVVNVSGVYYPIEKHAGVVGYVHMVLNTLFIIIYSLTAYDAGTPAMYLILGFALNLVFLNIAYLKLAKTLPSLIFFGVCAVLMGAFMIGLSSELVTIFMPYPTQVFNSLIVILLVAAISIFFYIVHTGRADEAFQYYFGMVFTLFMLVGHSIEHLYLWGLVALFVIAKCWRRIEGEPMNALMTAMLFLAALDRDFDQMYWTVVILSVLSIPLIRRWRLYYQYAITIFLVMFAYNNAPTGETILPIVAAILFALVPAFHFFALRWGEAPRGDKRDIICSQAYNLTNMGMLAFVNLLCLTIQKDFWYASVVTLFGAAWLVFYLAPRFYLEFPKKYLALIGYLTFMTLVVIPFPDPIATSITMMVIAVISVAIGVKMEDKPQRQCGLVLTLFVCAKIGIFDFRESEPLQRIIVLMVVGVIAMIISVIYFRLEKGLREAAAPLSDEGAGENTDFSEIGVEKNAEEVYTRKEEGD
jgi:hypothetical protein